MQINFNNNKNTHQYIAAKNSGIENSKTTNQTFTGKNPDIRLASDIMRAAKLDVPMFSPNYAHYFYKCTKPESKFQKQANKLCDMLRDRVNFGVRLLTTNSPKENLDSAKFYSLGHCYEKAMAVMAELFSKGYDKTSMTGVLYKINYTNKKTGKPVCKRSMQIDHVFVTSSMNNKNVEGMKKRIVIDPWLDFTGTVPEAMAKYKDFYKNILDAFDKTTDKHLRMMGKKPDKYNVEKKLEFSNAILKPSEILEIQNYLK